MTAGLLYLASVLALRLVVGKGARWRPLSVWPVVVLLAAIDRMRDQRAGGRAATVRQSPRWSPRGRAQP